MDERAFITDVLHEAAMQISDAYPPEESREKAAREVVTETDLSVEQHLRQRIMQQYPAHGIRGEELDNHQPDSSHQWIIDPVDGTTNFAHEIPLFCCAIALLEDDEVVAAGVVAPVTGTLYTAQRGAGAYKDGERIQTPEQELASGVVGFCHASDQEGIQTIARMYEEGKKQTRDFRKLGSANLEICMAASGALAGFIGYRIKPWDFLAGCLVAHEAGARVTGWDEDDWQDPGVESVLVAHPDNHQALKSLTSA